MRYERPAPAKSSAPLPRPADEKKLAMRRLGRQCFEQRFEIKKTAGTLHEVLANVTGVN
jgi:hypothetical protein